uniref:Uncharacterized protein n=1 Tax=Lepeophtheirus salmonis TaxID=72036 RepID=A0A0K2TAK0_LEPSM
MHPFRGVFPSLDRKWRGQGGIHQYVVYFFYSFGVGNSWITFNFFPSDAIPSLRIL